VYRFDEIISLSLSGRSLKIHRLSKPSYDHLGEEMFYDNKWLHESVLEVTDRRYKNIGGSKFLKEKAVFTFNTTIQIATS